VGVDPTRKRAARALLKAGPPLIERVHDHDLDADPAAVATEPMTVDTTSE
jgi:hypothetical protein